jgi:putative ABC transport system permease protein
MIKNYFTVALRNIMRYKFFSLINILGLTIGMTTCLFIYIFVKDELSYDTFHKDYQNIYRIGLEGKIGTQELNVSTSNYPLARALQEVVPGIEQSVRLWPREAMVFKNGDKVFTEKDVFYADSTFVDFFSFPLLKGNPSTALLEPNSAVLTPALATKYFGDDDPMGKILTIGNDNKSFKVTGIISPAPSNSHLQFTALLSFITVDNEIFHGWTGNSLQTYIKKNPNTSVAEVNQKLEELVEKHVGPELQQGLGVSYEEFKKNGGKYAYYIFPLADTHLKSTDIQDQFENSDIKYVYIFSIVGGFILLIACINFMNLSTAKSAGRAKEAGLRKALGSQRGQLIGQFLSESLFYSVTSIVLAVGLCCLLLPSFNLLAGKTLAFSSLNNLSFIGGAFMLIILVGVLAGSYPAFYLTAFNPTEVLKGKIKSGLKSKGVRSSLVVVQFAISIFLIISTAIVFKQLSFLQTRNMGIDRQSVFTLQHLSRLGTNQEAFKTELVKETGIVSASFTNNSLPGQQNTTVFREKGNDKDYLFETFSTDHDYQSVLKLEMVEGRFFSNNISDTATVVINEAAAKEFGWNDNFLTREVINFNPQTPVALRVVGVVKDFAFESMKDKVRPVILQYSPKLRFLMVRYEGNPQEKIEQTQTLWRKFASGEPFEYSFLDQNFDNLFRSEQRLKNIATVFTSLAIFIACLGLFALAAFTTEQRTKEIGIRKALGASVPKLTVLLSKEFTILVMIAFVPAAAAAWYFSANWLNGFAYRTEVGIILFIIGGIASLVVAWLTVAYQSIKAARSNPVESLRYE